MTMRDDVDAVVRQLDALDKTIHVAEQLPDEARLIVLADLLAPYTQLVRQLREATRT
ncbi:MAG TPA: hypothetical protein VHD87_13030 [Acidimicrobiales bacterium]|nr:hypothetical protein [Acidimicrobiales bacterium]